MVEDNQEVRRVFISYSWTSPEHVEWVIDLANRLMSDGIDVVIDKWYLSEGQDKYAFMEKMVNDDTINKVLAICDRRYAEKADGREGGVGTESQIMSEEVYRSVDQKKFIPIVTEYYEDGKPCLPTFFKARIYIDMSTTEKLHENYEQLVRNIYDKPLFKKPTRGKTPSYILDADRIPSKTLSKLQMLREAVMKGRPDLVKGLSSDYLRSYSDALEDYRISWPAGDLTYGAQVLSSIQSFLPYRDEFIDFMRLVSQYVNDPAVFDEIHKFFEDVLKYQEKIEDTRPWNELWIDNYRFIMYELFLYALTILIDRERFDMANLLIAQPYFQKSYLQPGKFVGLRVFNANLRSLRDSNPKYNYSFDEVSVTAELFKERATHRDPSFHSIMQTDFILCARSVLHNNIGLFTVWFPQTFQFIDHGYGPFDLFIKAELSKYFDYLKILLDVKDKQDLEKRIEAADSDGQVRMILGRYGTSLYALLRYNNLERLDTRP